MVKELERRQRIKQMLYSIPSLLLLAAATFFLVKGAIGIMKIERDSAGKVKTLEAQAAESSLRGKKLTEDINKLRTEAGIMEEIKEKFSVTREGEYVAIIVDARNKAISTDETGLSWIKALWNAIRY